MNVDLNVYPISVEQNVQWGEMDAFQHVNNSVYFKYFENARIRFMEELGLSGKQDNNKVNLILARVEANFRIPLTYPDTICTYLRVKEIRNTSFTVEQMVWSVFHNGIACVGKAVLVLFDYDSGSKVTIPDDLRSKLESYKT